MFSSLTIRQKKKTMILCIFIQIQQRFFVISIYYNISVLIT